MAKDKYSANRPVTPRRAPSLPGLTQGGGPRTAVGPNPTMQRAQQRQTAAISRPGPGSPRRTK